MAFATTSGSTDGSFIQSASSATAGNLVALFDNTAGTGSPLAITYVENIGATYGSGSSANVSGYSTSAGAWNVIIPNSNANGVQRIEQLKVSDASVVGCASDIDGVWATGTVNTVNPTNGSGSALAISNTDAPLNVNNCCDLSNPTTQASVVTFPTVGTNTMTVSWTSGNGANRYVVINTTNSFTNPTDGIAPGTANASYSGSGEQIVYSGSGNSVAVSGLTPGNTYWFRVYEYNCSGGNTRYITSTATRNPNSHATNTAVVASLSPSPSSVSGLSTSSGVASASGSFNLTGSNLDGSNIILTAPSNFEVSLNNSTFSGSVTLQNGNPATYASPALNSTTIYVRIKSTASAGNVSGSLTMSGGSVSSPPSVSLSGFVIAAEPTTQATNVTFSNITAGSVDVNWTNGNGSARIVVISPSTATAVAPADGNSYTANAYIASSGTTGASNYVVLDGTTGPVTVSGLTGSTTYNVEVYEYNGSGTTANYLTSTATNNPNGFTTSAPTYYWNGPTNSTAAGITAGGGTGTWNTGNTNWVAPTNPGTGTVWADHNKAVLGGTAGTITISNGTTFTPTTTQVSTTGYVITSAGTTTTVIGGDIALDNNVNLNFIEAAQTASRTLSVGNITGGTGSKITIQGAQTGTNNSRINISQSGASISVPIVINGTGANTAFAGVVATASGTSITNTVTNNNTQPTVIGATSGNSITISGSGKLTGSGDVVFAAGSSGGAGTVNLNTANDYTGSTLLNLSQNGTVKLGVSGALPSTTSVQIGNGSANGGILDLNGHDITVAGLSSNVAVSSAGLMGIITDKSSGAGTTHIIDNQAGNTSLGIPINDGTNKIISLEKQGAGTLTITIADTFSGYLKLTGGLVQMGINANIFVNSLPFIFNGGGFGNGSPAGYDEAVGTIQLLDNSHIDFGTGNRSLKFNNSSSVSWTSGKTLTVNGWAGTAGSSGNAGKLFIGTDNTGLTAQQLSQITFTGFNPGAAILNTGEIVPASATLTVNQTGFNGAFGTISLGSSSAEQHFAVSGSALASTVVITPLSGYEISLTSGSGFQTGAITLSTTGGVLATTT
ncbi:MAG TPA: hypothetical protein VG603_06675, partial [Chitinophagales bacterium]|nr:hypothetical protein [Chitinophagales bacterium]